MNSLPGPWERQAYRGIKRFCELRPRGDLSENDITEELGFGLPEAMRIQLKNWGLSGPLVDNGSTGDEDETQRKASSSGEVKELPAVGQAERLFRTDLVRLTYYVDVIPKLREHLQGKLYASFSWAGEDWEEYYRSDYAEEDWEDVCRDFNEDPDQEAFRVAILPYMHYGAGRHHGKALLC
jgi:hypothetical protein